MKDSLFKSGKLSFDSDIFLLLFRNLPLHKYKIIEYVEPIINPENNEVIKGSVEDATKLIMKNIQSILDEAGFNFKDVVRSKIYLTDMNNFSKVNAIYGSYFEKNYEPARTTIEVSGLPLGVDVEIDMIAVN